MCLHDPASELHEAVSHRGEVEAGCVVGQGTRVWDHACVIRGSRVGEDCTIGRHAHIEGSTVGDRCKVQTFAYLPPGVTLEDEVFVGPAAVFTNHKRPQAVREGGEEFVPEKTLVKKGAVIGANATIGPGVTIGQRAVIAAGAVVMRDVPDGGFVYGTTGPTLTPNSWSVQRGRDWRDVNPEECGEL